MFNLFPYTDMHELNLDWILQHFEDFVSAISSLDEWRAEHEQEYLELKDLYDDLISGDFPDSFNTALTNWVVTNTVSIIGAAIKMVFFDLSPDGYLVANIPSTWSEIMFGTSGYDTYPAGVDFGHLTITY